MAGVSYPTVRNRLDKVIESLRAQIAQRDVNGRATAKSDSLATRAPTEVSSQESDAAEIIRRIG